MEVAFLQTLISHKVSPIRCGKGPHTGVNTGVTGGYLGGWHHRDFAPIIFSNWYMFSPDTPHGLWLALFPPSNLCSNVTFSKRPEF